MELLEVTISLLQALMGRPKETITKEESILLFNSQVLHEGGNESCHYVGHSKLKSIDYDAFLGHKQLSAELTSCIVYSTVSNKMDNTSTANSTSVKDKSYEVSIKTSSVNEPH